MILPLSLLFSLSAWAQTAAFEGTVKGADGKPQQGAMVKIDRQDVKGNYKVKTDKKGHYFYGGLPLGNYKITVEVDGQDRDQKTGRARPGDPIDVSFDLAAAAGGAPAVDDSTRGESAADKANREKQGKEQAAAMAKNKALNDAFNAGKTAAAANDWSGAIDGFTKATEVDPNQHVVWGNLADSYSSRAKMKNGAEKEADLAKAGEAYAKAITIKGDDAAYHNNYALILAQQKKFDEAQGELTKAATIDAPNAGKYYYNLGAVYINGGNNDRATETFKMAIDKDPNYAEAYYQYGLALMGKATTDPTGKIVAPAGTQEAFQKYLDLAPTGPNVEAAKAMITSMGATVQTNVNQRQNNQKKKQ
jgi:tetratricopeptide (TPR) repeat protein